MQLAYEAFSACTSIVARTDAGQVALHMRTMDWEMPYLAPLTFNARFVRNGVVLYEATMWAGQTGILTGIRRGVCSISVNFRLSSRPQFMRNVKNVVGSAWPVSFLVREVLDSATSYEEAKAWLEQSSLVAPVYFTVCGPAGEGCVITRGRDPAENRETLTLSDERPYLVQPNQDHDAPPEDGEGIMDSRTRRLVASEILAAGGCDEQLLWQVVNTAPVMNDLTLYGTIMMPHDGTFKTVLPNADDSFGDLPESSGMAVPLRDTVRSVPCSRCGRAFFPELNVAGFCRHEGEWHDAFGKCTARCAAKLGLRNIGKCHYACCGETHAEQLQCEKSEAHTV